MSITFSTLPTQGTSAPAICAPRARSKASLILTAALVATVLLPAAAANANDNFSSQPQTRTSCVKPQVWAILNRLAAKVGELELTAGCNGKHARHSYHYRGMAMDFRARNVSQRTVIALLRADPAVGGVIAEGNGLVHVDTGRRGESTYVAWRTGTHHHHTANRRYAMR